MSRTIKNEQLYIQEERNMFINPPFDFLPSVSFQCKTFRTILVRERCLQAGAAAPLAKNHPLPAD